MNNKMNIPLSGIIPPLVTPLLDDDVLDVEGLQRLIEHLIAGGVHALFVLGTTGESQSLSYKLRVEMIKNTCRIAKGRLPHRICGMEQEPTFKRLREYQESVPPFTRRLYLYAKIRNP